MGSGGLGEVDGRECSKNYYMCAVEEVVEQGDRTEAERSGQVEEEKTRNKKGERNTSEAKRWRWGRW